MPLRIGGCPASAAFYANSGPWYRLFGLPIDNCSWWVTAWDCASVCRQKRRKKEVKSFMAIGLFDSVCVVYGIKVGRCFANR
ncbi:hypothetical protein [Spirosoma telluris]|uniref:hypothetical protein n=1 Tax=Spirosoma telluris TaxID=2183553 RepID=UPI002FC2E73E